MTFLNKNNAKDLATKLAHERLESKYNLTNTNIFVSNYDEFISFKYTSKGQLEFERYRLYYEKILINKGGGK